GPEDSQVTWEGSSDGQSVISGGRRIGGWKPAGGGLWRAEIPEVREEKWYFEQLWVNGRRAVRARTPNKGFLHMDAPATSGIFPGKGSDQKKWEDSLRNLAFCASPETIRELGKATPEELRDLALIVPHNWDAFHYRVRTIDPVAGAVLLKPHEEAEFRQLLPIKDPSGRFYVENYRAALDAPGEWFLGRDGGLLYYPLPGEDMSRAEVVAPVAKTLLKVDGAEHITFRNLSFVHQQWTMGSSGYGDSQSSHRLGAAIEVNRSKEIIFDQCEIAHIGTYGIWFDLDVTKSGIGNSHIHDLGAGGVRIGPTAELNALTDGTGFITVDNNIIQQGGRIFPDAVGILIGYASDNTVTHNDIGDFYYTGISSGWHYGYGESFAYRNRYENNHIHHLGWGVMSDMGGFYNLGAALGTVVRGNHIHDISRYRYGGWGIYADEGTSGILIENNLVHDTTDPGFRQHFGYYNLIRNNIFAFGKNAQIGRSRPEGRLRFIFEKNIVVWDADAPLLEGDASHWNYQEKPLPGEPKKSYEIRKNLYWPIGGKMPARLAGTWTWEEWQQRRDKGSIVADPLFENVLARDFRLKADSPAKKIGFVPWDLSLAGVRADGPKGAAWPRLAAQRTFPNWKEDSKPWPLRPFTIALNTFENAAPGTLPLLTADPRTENKSDSIGVSEDASSPIPVKGASPTKSVRSLKFQDAPGLSVRHHPLLTLTPNWEKGTVSVTFDVMGEPGADWYFEMRTTTYGNFSTGPRIAWQNGALVAGESPSTTLCNLPPREWVRVSITATLGTGTWQVSLTRQNGSVQNFDNLPCKPGWNRCASLLWVASADKKSAFFVDNLEVIAKP
ncbi:MAG: right-handed parallel beta-helix repeat-containing protein, partial [Chthoniobacterales bacterium]|nr:right-handed parallel beta-helix repeat-containing protein [Chthoniobacterales bacterium]